jgi:hypothetical protein
MDLSKFSDQDLKAISEGNLSAVSDDALLLLSGEQKPNLTAGEVATQAVKNFPSSAANIAKDLYTAVTNPLETGKAVLDLGAGILQNVLPEGLVKAIGEDPASREVANKVGQFYVGRYGSVEGAKQAIAKDPAGVLADVSTILYGGGALAPGRAGAALSRTGAIVDPLAIAARTVAATGRGAGNVIAPVLGMTTGAGGESIKQAFAAGREGGERAAQFRENITGRASMDEVLNAAKQNLAELERLKSQEYRSGMADIKRDKSQLGFDGIEEATQKAIARTRFNEKVIDETAAQKVADVQKEIADWKNSDPATYHTPEGMDALKRRIGSILDTINPQEQKNAFASVNSIYKSIGQEISKQAPVYSNTMRDYAKASDEIREIERTLSIGNKSSVDTAMRKLQSLMRDNVNTNYGQRVKMAKELEQKGGNLMMPGIAGQALQSKVPRGLSQISAGGLVPYLGLSGQLPQAATVAATSSPRLMGEAAYLTGLAGRGASAVAGQVPFAVNPELYNLLYQSGQLKGLLEQ